MEEAHRPVPFPPLPLFVAGKADYFREKTGGEIRIPAASGSPGWRFQPLRVSVMVIDFGTNARE
jgi:hypothetical protein